MRKEKMGLILLLTLVTYSVFAKQKKLNNNIPDPLVTININIMDTTMLNEASIEFKLYKNDISSENSLQADYYEYEIKNGKTKLVIPLSTALNYGRIYYTYKNKNKNPLNHNNSLFIFEAGDNIQIYLDGNHAFFMGKGSEKYNCSYQVAMHQDMTESQNYTSNNFFKKNDYFEGMSYLIKCEDSLYQLKRTIIEKYSTNINNKVYNLMLADAWGNYNTNVVGIIFGPTVNNNIEKPINDAIEKLFKIFSKNLKSNIFSDSILAQSFQYCDFLLWKEIKSQYFFKKLNELPNSYTYYVNNSINTNYAGLVKGKLKLINYYSGMTDNADLIKEDVSRPLNHYQKAINDYISKLTIGAFPFELPDETGKLHKLSDFKGKLVVMDFWFTGCHGCVGMAKALKPVIQEFKTNPKIVFLSVSVDGDKFKHFWVESLKNEKYSSNDEINLLATKARESEVIKHYNITAYPKLVIISKEGNTISITPPDPRKDPLKFKDFLYQYL